MEGGREGGRREEEVPLSPLPLSHPPSLILSLTVTHLSCSLPADEYTPL